MSDPIQNAFVEQFDALLVAARAGYPDGLHDKGAVRTMNELTQSALVERLDTMLVAARKDVADDDERWARLACGQDTEEAEESGCLAGYADGLQAALELVKQAQAATAFVHVVEVFERMDGTYVFADYDDAVAFQATIDGGTDELPAGASRCSRTEEVVCSHVDALNLIAAECEASEQAIASSLTRSPRRRAPMVEPGKRGSAR